MENNKKNDFLDKENFKENKNNNNILVKKPKKTKKIKNNEKKFNEEDLNIDLYYEISSTIYNVLNNLVIRKYVLSHNELFKILELQISNLFFLEKELKELKDKKHSLEFLQLISNLTNRSLSVRKSNPKNRIEMLEEKNSLIITITNIFNNVKKENLEKIRVFDKNIFNQLNNQILTINNSNNNISEKKPLFSLNNSNLNSDINKNPNIDKIKNLSNNLNINNIYNNSLANLAKLGVLPQHPAANSKFYPYVNKPKYIPILKKILSIFFLLTTALTITSYILTYFISGNFQIKDNNKSLNIYYNFAQQSKTIIFTIVTTISLNGGFLYSILKPPKLVREIYRISYFLIFVLFFWIIYTISNLIYMITDDSLLRTFNSFLDKDDKINPNVLIWLKGLSTFKVFKILIYITTISAILPIVTILVIAIINPKIDRNKIIRANSEYQNAINSAINGKSYEIDQSLFDNSLDNNKKNKNNHNF